MRETDLDKRLDALEAPAPSALLKARILNAAKSEATALAPKSFTRRFMPIAASLLAVCAIGVATLQVSQPQTDETEIAAWQEAATDLGFEEIYNWVEAEETSTQES